MRPDWSVQLLQIFQTTCNYFIYPQDGNELPVAVKTCKEDNEESMTEKFLEEACKRT